MATDSQIAANRDNAKLSGPRTDEGKAISSLNNTRHRLTAAGIIVLPGFEEAFTNLQAGLRESLKPEGELQEVLFARILQCSWNQHRCRIAESEIYDDTSNPHDPLLDQANACLYDRIQKYARQYESSFHKALRTLGELQTEAAYRQQVSPVKEEPEAIPHARSEVCSTQKIDSTQVQPPIGFELESSPRCPVP